MTDIEKFVELYASFGIDCIVNHSTQNGCVQFIRLHEGTYCDPGTDTKSDKFDGYSGFYSEVTFDLDGKFIGQSFFE